MKLLLQIVCEFKGPVVSVEVSLRVNRGVVTGLFDASWFGHAMPSGVNYAQVDITAKSCRITL